MPRVSRSHANATPDEAVALAPGWSPWWCRVASVVIVLHLVGVFVAPWSFQFRSLLNDKLAAVYRPYLDAAYLNHGYAFFAPDPGPSHLIRYEVTQADGKTVGGVFPNPEVHWPRLLYHRHFMLTEFVANCPPELGRDYVRSYAEHLLAKHDGQEVKLAMRRHLLPGPEDVLAGMQLDDPRLYEEFPLGRFGADGTAEYPPPPEVPPGLEDFGPRAPFEMIPTVGDPTVAAPPPTRPEAVAPPLIRLPEVPQR